MRKYLSIQIMRKSNGLVKDLGLLDILSDENLVMH